MNSPPFRIAVLASGRGSNFVALADAVRDGRLQAEMVGVFSDRPLAAVLERAAERGIEARAFAPKAFADRSAYEVALFAAVDAVRPDLIVCAGYMRLLGSDTVQRRRGRMINIHPSLLPAHRGLHTHQRALEAGDREHGASVHFVTPELDGGPVIAQARVPVLPDDDADMLAARVLEREHPLLLATVALLAAGRVELDAGDTVRLDGRVLGSPLQLDSLDSLG
jgi:phosphoribosylglycinamide formyltransferase 1